MTFSLIISAYDDKAQARNKYPSLSAFILRMNDNSALDSP
jgi:hypothetical protein